MKSYLIQISIFIIFSSLLKAQTNIQGVALGIKDGYVEITPEFSKIFYKKEKIDNGRFSYSISGLDSIPQPVFIKMESSEGDVFVTERFYIDKKTEQIVIIYNHNIERPKVEISPLDQNQIDFLNKKNYFADIDLDWKYYSDFVQLKLKTTNKQYEQLNAEDKIQIDSLRNSILAKQEIATQDFIQNNPNSYIALWDLYRLIAPEKSKKTSLDLYENFSNELKTSPLGIACLEKLNSFSENKLPNYQLKDIQNQEVNFNNIKLNKYTLIDFWFSHCAPCLQQMPTYKNLYDQYKSKGFEIIGISTDRTQDIENWNKIIQDKKLNWIQLLDENGTESQKYNINKFPTTYLLDSEGKIIKKDISPEELEIFLQQNL